MPNLNNCEIIGHLGTEPEMRFMPTGRPVVSFNVAVNRRYTTGSGERREETEWFTVVAFGKLAENCNISLTKGQAVFVSGRVSLQRWEGKDDNLPKSRLEINARQVIFLSPNKVVSDNIDEEDDIPF